MKSKVCHITSVHDSNDNRIFRKECRSLAKAGYTVSLVAPGLSRQEDGVTVVGIGPKSANRIQRMFCDTKHAIEKAATLAADVYHLHDPELLTYALKLKKMGKIVIFDSHENVTQQIMVKRYIPRLLRSFIAKLYFRYETFVCKRIDAVIIPGLSSQTHDNYFAGRAKCVAIVGNSAREEDFLDDSNDRDRSYICCTGSLTYERGITHLVKASYRADVPLVLAGGISSTYLRELQEMPEFKIVSYLGKLPVQRLSEILGGAFLGVSALLSVGQYKDMNVLPTKVPEYMLAGLPVLLQTSKYNDDLVNKYQIGATVDPLDIDAFAYWIDWFQNNRDEACKMGERGRCLARQEYSWGNDESKLFELYHALTRDDQS